MVLEVPIFSQKRLDILPVPHYIVCDQTDREGDFMGRKKEVGHEIHVLSNMIGRKIDEEKRQRNMADVSPVQIWVVRYLHEHKGEEICQRDLERDFNVTRSTVTGILQIMEKKGYILRVSVPTDARLKKILLTEKGEKLYYKVRDHIHETETFLVKGMTEEEVEQLLFLLGKIKHNLTT